MASRWFTRAHGLAALVASTCSLLACSDEAQRAAEPPPCAAADIRASMQQVAAEDLGIWWDVTPGSDLDLVREDLQAYLSRLWGLQVQVQDGRPDGSRRVQLWFSDSEEARAAHGLKEGYGFGYTDGGQTLVITASTRANLAHGIYAFLEELGVRFFHPRHELVPSLGGIYLPDAIAVARTPAMRMRGLQLHLLHPLEYLRPFTEPGAQNLEDAKEVIDWLVKTGQNHVQWHPLRTVELDAWKPHAAAIVEYAHSRGVTVGTVVMLWGGASLQNAYDLITSEQGWQEELEGQLDYLLTVPWDVVELGLGEFFSGNPVMVLEWLNHATAYMADNYPQTELSITNHVGNYPELWINYQGEELFYYHLPGRADPRLTNTTHTVYFFDLYRDWGGYGHPSFELHRDFLFEQLPSRKMRYMPESAYWCTADIDVPLFLPEYIHARWLDIHHLHKDITDKGLPALDGHIMFSSGHEWGYWLTDYLSAKMLWEPARDLTYFTAHYGNAFGTCGAELTSALDHFTSLQGAYLFDRKLAGYLATEDLHDDVGFLANIETHPTRVPYDKVLEMNEQELSGFMTTVVGSLDELAAASLGVEERVRQVCARVDVQLQPWCAELLDGVEVTRLRTQHASLLYKAVVTKARGAGGADSFIEQARAVTDQAAVVIARREQAYRYPVEELVGQYSNATRYPFGYLRQAHTQCLWRRLEDSASFLLEYGYPNPFTALDTCQM